MLNTLKWIKHISCDLIYVVNMPNNTSAAERSDCKLQLNSDKIIINSKVVEPKLMRFCFKLFS